MKPSWTEDMFLFVVLSAQRARELSLGAPSELDQELKAGEKTTYVAINEIEQNIMTEENLWNSIRKASRGEMRFGQTLYENIGPDVVQGIGELQDDGIISRGFENIDVTVSD